MTAAESILSMRSFGVAFGDRVVLSSIDLDVPARELTVVLGPGGTGKTTLLRTLSGFNDANPSLRTWGEVTFAGRPLADGVRPAMVAQSARLIMATLLENIMHHLPERRSLSPNQQRELASLLLEDAGLGHLQERLDESVIHLGLGEQRQLAIMRLAASGPRLILMDEPTTGLNDTEATRLLDYLAREGQRRAMMVVLHNQAHARQLGGNTVLLAGGHIQAAASSESFFHSPPTPLVQGFLKTGSCALPAPDADPETLDPDTPPPPPMPQAAMEFTRDSFGPRGFLWLKKGSLAGTPRPGVVHDLAYDLQALKRVGVTHLFNLTEIASDEQVLATYGIANTWSPIVDMTAPSLTQGAWICARITQSLSRGDVVAVHCHAGLGRTGTILAAYLIWEGADALDALESVRRIEPRWVQSDEQVAFLQRFATRMQGRKLRLLANQPEPACS